MSLNNLDCDDHVVTDAERDFYKSFAVILEYLKNRALKAEAEVKRLRQELDVPTLAKTLGDLDRSNSK